MESRRKPRRQFDDQFKLGVLKVYYSSDVSMYSICRKYGINSHRVHVWKERIMEETVPLTKGNNETGKKA